MLVELYCRMDQCETAELYDDEEQAVEGEWSKISKFGVANRHEGDEVIYRYQAFCPSHSLEDDPNVA